MASFDVLSSSSEVCLLIPVMFRTLYIALYSFLFNFLLVLFEYHYWCVLYNNPFQSQTFLARP